MKYFKSSLIQQASEVIFTLHKYIGVVDKNQRRKDHFVGFWE